MPLRLDSYRPAMPVGRGGFGQRRNPSFHFSRPLALLTVKNANSAKWQSHFADMLKRESAFFQQKESAYTASAPDDVFHHPGRSCF